MRNIFAVYTKPLSSTGGKVPGGGEVGRQIFQSNFGGSQYQYVQTWSSAVCVIW